MAATPKSAAREKRCGVCGHESRQPGFRPPMPEQAPDLDLRPGEPVRSTMARWLEACPHCGYAAPDITESHPAGAEAVAAAPYRALIADTSHPVLARRFLAWAHVLEETGALHAAAEATLHAAWVADDLNRDDLARQWRREAVALWRSGPALDAEQSVRVIDALRRAADFVEAEGAAEALAALNPPEAVAQVVALEARLIAAEDMGRHSIASAIAPPARRPHVTHQPKKRPPAGGGLKSWLRRIFKG
ncbi:MAG: hypothetical protein JHC89_03340 [Acetobacteraceae bacterium]|nr:hypothetical protein [Acetobacteraceae bacterium]